jgi:hypothetical protein
MAGSREDDDRQHSPRTRGIIQHFVRKVKLHTDALDEDLQTTNEKLGQLELAQIDTNTKLGRVDTSLAALLRRFDDLMAGSNNNQHRENSHGNEHGSGENDEYSADTEVDDRDHDDYVIIIEVWKAAIDVRYATMMLLVRLNLRSLLLMVNMILMHTLLGSLLLIKSLHAMNFLRTLVLGLLLVNLLILHLFGGWNMLRNTLITYHALGMP